MLTEGGILLAVLAASALPAGLVSDCFDDEDGPCDRVLDGVSSEAFACAVCLAYGGAEMVPYEHRVAGAGAC